MVEYEEETQSHAALTYDHSSAIGTWAVSGLPPGQALREPAPLFKKLDESVIEEEYARLEGQQQSASQDAEIGSRGIYPNSLLFL